MARIAVIGGGITGLAAAYEADRQGHDAVLFESNSRVGGKIRASPFAGRLIDEAADAFLARVPWAVELCDELGLTPRLTQPAARSAFVWSQGELRRLPAAQLLGVPTDLDELERTGIVSADGIAAARLDLDRTDPPPAGDPSIGSLLRDHLGDEIVEVLVGPLVGGINAGDVDRLSLRGCAAQIAAAADAGGSLIAAAAAVTARTAASRDAPVFHAPIGGMTELIDRLQASLEAGVELRIRTPVDRIERVGAAWQIVGDPHPFDAVVVTAPAPVAARLVAPAKRAAELLGAIDHASVAMITLAFDRSTITHDLDGSGFLVPAIEGRVVTACSFASSKWAHLGSADTVILRVSVGRDGDAEEATGIADDVLIDQTLADLDDFIGLSAPPTATRISRWDSSLPQYRPGHLDRVGEIEDSLHADLPGVVVAGAAMRGLGVPACIQQGRQAIRDLAGR